MAPTAFAEPHERCAHRRYWLTCDEYDAIARDQGQCCKICGDPGPLVVDHDHTRGLWAVRGLVCGLCNTLLAQVDNGRWDATVAVEGYLAGAWHVTAGARIKPEKRHRSARRHAGTPVRGFRVSNELWFAACAEAERRGESVSDILRARLEEYVSKEPSSV